MGRDQRANPFSTMRRANPSAAPDRNTVYDSLGRVVEAGDMVMFASYPGLRWRVASAKPVLRPDVPPGLVEVTFTAVITQGVQGGAANPELIKIGDFSEMADYTPEKAAQMGRTLEPVALGLGTPGQTKDGEGDGQTHDREQPPDAGAGASPLIIPGA